MLIPAVINRAQHAVSLTWPLQWGAPPGAEVFALLEVVAGFCSVYVFFVFSKWEQQGLNNKEGYCGFERFR